MGRHAAVVVGRRQVAGEEADWKLKDRRKTNLNCAVVLVAVVYMCAMRILDRAIFIDAIAEAA